MEKDGMEKEKNIIEEYDYNGHLLYKGEYLNGKGKEFNENF